MVDWVQIAQKLVELENDYDQMTEFYTDEKVEIVMPKCVNIEEEFGEMDDELSDVVIWYEHVAFGGCWVISVKNPFKSRWWYKLVAAHEGTIDAYTYAIALKAQPWCYT